MLSFQNMEEDTKGFLEALIALNQDTGSSKLHSEITATALALLRRPSVSEQLENELKNENPPEPKKRRTFVYRERELLWKMQEMNDRRFRWVLGCMLVHLDCHTSCS